jgi:hypothetical protein
MNQRNIFWICDNHHFWIERRSGRRFWVRSEEIIERGSAGMQLEWICRVDRSLATENLPALREERRIEEGKERLTRE